MAAAATIAAPLVHHNHHHQHAVGGVFQRIHYYLSDHPTVTGFRWGPPHTPFSTWSFLIPSILIYLTLSIFLQLTITLISRYTKLKFHHRHSFTLLGPIHSLLMFITSLLIFTGTLLSSTTEIHQTRWLWHHSHLTTPIQYLLCFPLGTRSSGRVFFWSYLFFLSRYLHASRTFIKLLHSHTRLTFFHLFKNSFLIIMSFLWLEFSQSFQIMAILLTTAYNSVVYGFKFLRGIGLVVPQGKRLPRAVVGSKVVALWCHVGCQIGVVVLHYAKNGCNGVGGGAWVFNCVGSGVILFSYMDFYVNFYLKPRRPKGKLIGRNIDYDESNSSHYNYNYSSSYSSLSPAAMEGSSRRGGHGETSIRKTAAAKVANKEM